MKNNVLNLFITNPTNIRYLTGFVGVDERDAYVLLTNNQAFLFTNSLYRELAKKLERSGNRVQGTDVQFVEISRENPISRELLRITTDLKTKELGFEDTNLTVAELSKLKKVLTDVKLIPIRDRIEKLRMIKRKDEIDNIRLAATITDQCFKYMLNRIRPGATESRLAWEIESFFRKNGAENAFSPIVAFGKHTSQPHYQVSNNWPFDFAQGEQNGILQKQDVVLLDFGASVNGYCADMTRVVFLGTPKVEWIKTYTTVLKAQTDALKYLEECFNVLIHQYKRIPISGSKADQISRKVIELAGLPTYPHSLGHAVGLDIHEAPRLTVKKDEKLESDMVITVEPGVYLEGQYGIRIEDLVLLTDTGIDILSKSPKEIIVL